MAIHEGEGEAETPQGEGDTSAEFSGAWDELDAAERGQPEETPGRSDEAGEGEDQGGDEAEQGSDEDTSSDASAADQASGEEDSDDPWASADPRLRALYEQSEARARSSGGRAGQLAKELKELRAALAEQRDAGNATAKGDEATDREERLQQLREEYPEVAAPILDMLQKQEERLKGLEGSQQAQATSDLDAVLAEQPTELARLHPDWQSVVQSPAYAAWLDTTPPAIQRIVREENAKGIVNAADCAFVIDLFKAGLEVEQSAVGELDQRRSRQLRAGSMPTTKAPPVQRERPDSFDAEWERLDAIERQGSRRR